MVVKGLGSRAFFQVFYKFSFIDIAVEPASDK
jgi:hypothetical protein